MSGLIDGGGSATVDVLRGGLVESRHEVSVVVAEDGRASRVAGDPRALVFARSAVKPFQALPLVEDGVLEGLGLGDEELAMACASHSGEPRHAELAERMLAAAGLDEAALACGPQWPLHEPSTRALRGRGGEAGRIYNNCSGKHAGMLALAVAKGWDPVGYHEAAHPVQQRMLHEMARWTGVAAGDIGTGVDGCGVVTFAVPLDRLAVGFGRFAEAAAAGAVGPARVLAAMAAYPELVAGTGRLCTRLMQATGGRVVAKVGAEGVYCACVPGTSLGIALKVRDGGRRAAEPALLAVLRGLGVLGDAEVEELARYVRPAVRNTRGEVVGALEARVALEPVGG